MTGIPPMTPTDAFADEPDPVAPQCRPTADTIQSVLDGDAAPAALAADPHPLTCATCRERVRAARVLLAVLTAPADAVAVPAGFTEKVMGDVWGAWHARRRKRVRTAGALVALAAAVLVAAFAIFTPRPERPDFVRGLTAPVAPVEEAPAPREKAPAVRIGDEVAKAGQSLREAPQPLAESVAVAPKLLDAFAGAFRGPAGPMPMGEALEPARRSLAELPDAARTGLEPVTGTAQKALDRLLRDVAAVSPKS